MVKKFLYSVLIAISGLMGVSAIAGGVGLMMNGFGMPLSYLARSPFSSYFWPGVILFVAVGCTQLFATYLLLRENGLALAAETLASFATIIWIFGEMYATPVTHWLQIIVFAAGLLQIGVMLLLLGALKKAEKPDQPET